MLKTTNHEHKEAIYFLGEQARCLTQAGSADAQICRKAAEFLIGKDENLKSWLAKQIDVKPFADNTQDYDTEEFEGKKDSLQIALKDLRALAEDESVPAVNRAEINDATDIVEDFYGVEL